MQSSGLMVSLLVVHPEIKEQASLAIHTQGPGDMILLVSAE